MYKSELRVSSSLSWGFAAAQRWCWVLGPVNPSSKSLIPSGTAQSCVLCSSSRYLQHLSRVGPCCWDVQTFLVKLQPAWANPGCAGGQQGTAAAASFRNWCPAKLQHWQEDNQGREEALQGAETAWHSREEKNLQPRGTWGHSVAAGIHWGFWARLAHSRLRALHDRNVTCLYF